MSSELIIKLNKHLQNEKAAITSVMTLSMTLAEVSWWRSLVVTVYGISVEE